jgi:hypothetical protein
MNLYAYVEGNPIKWTDRRGLFGDGIFDGDNIPGHSDFFGGHDDWFSDDLFDYTAEDHGWTNPFLQPWFHFRPISAIEDDLWRALRNCNRGFFQRLMHQGQDTFTHWNNGYRWWRGGHVFDGTRPDNDDRAWYDANEWTRIWVDRWLAHCRCPDSGDNDDIVDDRLAP